MTFLAKLANPASIHALCFAVACVIAAPSAAQSRVLERRMAIPGRIDARERSETPATRPRRLLPGWPARFQLSGGLGGSLYSISPGGQIGNRGSVGIGARYFLAPVVDDDAPRSLQPFLQRTGSISARVRGGGFSTVYRPGGRGPELSRSYTYVGASAGVDAYLTPYLALTGGAEYAYDVLQDAPILNKGHSFQAAAGLGIRLGAARIDAAYAFEAYDLDGSLTTLRWGTVALSSHVVVAQAYAFTAAAHIGDGSAGGSLDFDAYTTKDFGFSLGLSGGTFHYSASNIRANHYAGTVGMSNWLGPMLQLSCAYEFQFNDSPAQPLRSYRTQQYEHTLSLGLIARLP